MGKGGGAGKVYFVLYLAVVLELLIIIVERDEAEELLHKKQKDTMKIVESILSQLQSGSGTEGINTRPKDEITIPPADQELGVDIKPDRQYTVEVGVTDVSHEISKLMRDKKPGKAVDETLEKKVRKLIALSNVAEIQYQVFYTEGKSDDAVMPTFISEDILQPYDTSSVGGFRDLEKGSPVIDDKLEHTWQFMGMRELKLNTDLTYAALEAKVEAGTFTYEDIIPVYSDSTLQYGDPCVTRDTARTRNFYFTTENKDSSDVRIVNKEEVKKRSFVVNFQPPENKGGWYKLRFTSRTNRILGVQKDPNAESEALDDKSTVNIGTVELTVKDLKKVYKELKKKVDGFGLPSLEEINAGSPNGGKSIDDLDAAVYNAKLVEDVTDEKKGNIELYGYIVKLLSPNKSQYFAQNKGDMTIDIRVIEPEMPPSIPGVDMPVLTYSFDKAPPVFNITALNFEKTKSKISIAVMDEAGNEVSTMRWEYKDGEEPTTNQPTTVRMNAICDETLDPGKYEVVVYHKKLGEESKEISKMEVFESALTPDSKRNIEAKFTFTTNYGGKTFFEAVPTSGGKIKSNQFRVYVKTDDEPDRKPTQGLSLLPATAMVYRPPTKTVEFKIVWVQPITGNEVTLYETSKPLAITMNEPSINANNKNVSFSGKTRKIRVAVSNIRVTPPGTGTDKKAIITASDISNFDIDVPGYNFSSEPYMSGSVEEGFEIEFELSGKPPTGKKKAVGTVTLTVPFKAQHPDYPSINSSGSTTINIPISYSGTR